MKRKRSFTLVEIMIVVVLASILFAATFQILHSGRISHDIGTTKLDVENNLRQGMDAMTRELYATRPDKIIVEPGGLPVIYFQVPVGSPDYNPETKQREFKWGADGNAGYYIMYYIGEIDFNIIGGSSNLPPKTETGYAYSPYLHRAVVTAAQNIMVGDTEKLLACYAKSLHFSLDGNVLTVTFSTGKKPLFSQEEIVKSLTTKITLRN